MTESKAMRNGCKIVQGGDTLVKCSSNSSPSQDCPAKEKDMSESEATHYTQGYKDGRDDEKEDQTKFDQFWLKVRLQEQAKEEQIKLDLFMVDMILTDYSKGSLYGEDWFRDKYKHNFSREWQKYTGKEEKDE